MDVRKVVSRLSEFSRAYSSKVCGLESYHNLNITPQLGFLSEFSLLYHVACRQILRVNYDSSDSRPSRDGNIAVST
jgi:hypothetical protein